MFKYVWIIILVGIYLIFGYASVKDIITTSKLREYDNIVDLFDSLNSVTIGFISFTVLILACSSFLYWIYCIAGG